VRENIETILRKQILDFNHRIESVEKRMTELSEARERLTVERVRVQMELDELKVTP